MIHTGGTHSIIESRSKWDPWTNARLWGDFMATATAPTVTSRSLCKRAFFLALLTVSSFATRSTAAQSNQGNSLKERLAKFITTSPDIVQFAKDKKYEEAWIIKSSAARPSTEECMKYLNKEKFELLIVEYVWNSQDDDKRFVLTLFQDKRAKMRDPQEFVKTSLDLFYKKLDFSTLMNTLDAEVIGKTYLLQNPVDAVTIGIFNYWFSTGPIDLWKAGDTFSEQMIRQKITARPDIEETRLNFQGLLFRFNVDGRYDGPFYGFKTPCCRKNGDSWIVDFPTIFRWMKFMLFEGHGKESSPDSARLSIWRLQPLC